MSWDEVRITTLEKQIAELSRQWRIHEEEIDTFVRTVWWKRWLFIIDGWSGHRVVEEPRWRPWRKWYKS